MSIFYLLHTVINSCFSQVSDEVVKGKREGKKETQIRQAKKPGQKIGG